VVGCKLDGALGEVALFTSNPIYITHISLSTLTLASHIKVLHASYTSLVTHAGIVDANDQHVTLGIIGNPEPLVIRISFKTATFQTIKNQWQVYTGGHSGEITAIDTYGNSMAVESNHHVGAQYVNLMQSYYLGTDAVGAGNLDEQFELTFSETDYHRYNFIDWHNFSTRDFGFLSCGHSSLGSGLFRVYETNTIERLNYYVLTLRGGNQQCAGLSSNAENDFTGFMLFFSLSELKFTIV